MNVIDARVLGDLAKEDLGRLNFFLWSIQQAFLGALMVVDEPGAHRRRVRENTNENYASFHGSLVLGLAILGHSLLSETLALDKMKGLRRADILETVDSTTGP